MRLLSRQDHLYLEAFMWIILGSIYVNNKLQFIAFIIQALSRNAGQWQHRGPPTIVFNSHRSINWTWSLELYVVNGWLVQWKVGAENAATVFSIGWVTCYPYEKFKKINMISWFTRKLSLLKPVNFFFVRIKVAWKTMNTDYNWTNVQQRHCIFIN